MIRIHDKIGSAEYKYRIADHDARDGCERTGQASDRFHDEAPATNGSLSNTGDSRTDGCSVGPGKAPAMSRYYPPGVRPTKRRKIPMRYRSDTTWSRNGYSRIHPSESLTADSTDRRIPSGFRLH